MKQTNDALVDLAKSVEIAKETGDPAKLADAKQAYAFAAVLDRLSHPASR